MLLDNLSETLPKILRAIPDEYRQMIRQKLEAAQPDFPAEHDTADIRGMLNVISTPNPGPSPSAPAPAP